LRILFVNPRAYLPQLLGGVETTTFDLCQQLTLMGHQPAVMCQIGKYDAIWLRNRIANRLTGRSFPSERYRGTLVYRGYGHRTGLAEVIGDFRPDAMVISSGHDDSFELAAHCASTGLPSLFYFHELTTLRRLAKRELLADVAFVANSAYTARNVRELLGRDAIVIPPLVDRGAYGTATSRRHVTMVNPRRLKGGQRAFDLAQACPDIPFVFVEAWSRDEFVSRLRAAARHLANVTWYKPRTDMRSIYASTRIQLVPSEWEETWGRVVTEAHASGSPVLGCAFAALPESVGPGGILLEPQAAIGDWIRALRSMWDDRALYETLSTRARKFSERPEAQPAHIAAAFIAAVQSSGTTIARRICA
jgi:glycosyltransferase involved in cell wall biosynthesis